MGVVLEAITAVMHHGVIIKPGEAFSCELNHAKKLVAGGSARLREREVEDTLVPDGADQHAEKRETLEKLTIPTLKEFAGKHDISIDSDDNKPEIIQKIIDAGVELDGENI